MMWSRSMQRPMIVPALAALLVCGAAGAAMSLRLSYAPLMIVGAAAALLALQWRAGVIVLLLALPFSGVPAFMAGSGGLVLRDVCIVAPLYVTFAVEMTRLRGRLAPEMGIALFALALFAALVVVQSLLSPTVLAGAIGVRVWLAYIPMLAIGYHFVRTRADFETMLKLTAILGLVPAALAIAECALAVTQGNFGPFEHIYGAWEIKDTQRFVVFTTSDGHLRIPRVPSTFTSVSQYFGFSLVAFTAALAMALRGGSVRWSVCAALLAAGALASGARSAYVGVPAVAVLSIALSGIRQSRAMALGVLTIVACGIVAAAQTDAMSIALAVPSHVGVTLRTAAYEMRSSFTLAGHGTGWDTNAALRYGGVTERRYIENWYAKAMLELGIGGLIAITVAFASIAWALLRGLPRLDTPSRRMAAPFVAMMLITMVLLFKGPYIDLDPLNVYVWLLLGAVFGLYRAGKRDGGGA